MASPTALRYWQAGIESVLGTAAAPSRRMYGTGEITKEIVKYSESGDRGSFDSRFQHDSQVISAGGSFESALYVDQLPEWLTAAVRRGVSASGPTDSVYTWKFRPGNTVTTSPGALTVEYFDGYQTWRSINSRVDSMSISGAVDSEITVSYDFMSEDRVALDSADSATALSNYNGLTADQPHATQGWEVELYIADSLPSNSNWTESGTVPLPSSDKVSGTLLEFEWTLANGLSRHYSGDNKQTVDAIVMGRRAVDMSMTLEFNSDSYGEYERFINPDSSQNLRFVELRLGGNTKIGAAADAVERLTIQTPVVFTAAEPGDRNGVSTLEMTAQNQFSSAAGSAFQIELKSRRN